MKPWHHEAGLSLSATDEVLVEAALEIVIGLVRMFGKPPGMLGRILVEAEFRVFVLPLRSPEYRRAYLAKNGAKDEVA